MLIVFRAGKPQKNLSSSLSAGNRTLQYAGQMKQLSDIGKDLMLSISPETIRGVLKSEDDAFKVYSTLIVVSLLQGIHGVISAMHRWRSDFDLCCTSLTCQAVLLMMMLTVDDVIFALCFFDRLLPSYRKVSFRSSR